MDTRGAYLGRGVAAQGSRASSQSTKEWCTFAMQPKGLHAASQRTERGAAPVRGSCWSPFPGSRCRPSYALGTTPPHQLIGVGMGCFPLRDDRFLRIRRRAGMWSRKQQCPGQPVCLAPKRSQEAFCLPSPQIYTYPCQPPTSPAAPTGVPQPCCPRGGAVETAGFEERPPNDGPGPAPGTRVTARNQGKSGPKPRSGTPKPGPADQTRLREPGAISQQPRTLGPGTAQAYLKPEQPRGARNLHPAPTPQDPTAIPEGPVPKRRQNRRYP